MNKNTFLKLFVISKMGMNLSLKVDNFSISKLFQCRIFTSVLFSPAYLFCAKTNLESGNKQTHKTSDFNLKNELERK